MNRSIKLLAITFALAAANAFAADTWRTQATAGYRAQDGDKGNSISGFDVGALQYFAPLPTEPTYPYAEYFFLERVGRVDVNYHRGSVESPTVETRQLSILSGDVTLTAPGYDFALRLGIDRHDYADAAFKNAPVSVKVDGQSMSVGVDYFPRSTLRLSLDHRQRKFTQSYTPSSISDAEFNYSRTGIGARYLVPTTDGRHFAINGGLTRIRDESADAKNIETNLGVRYYLDKRQYVFLGASDNRGDDKSDEGNSFSIAYGNRITRSVGVTGSITRFSVRDSAIGENWNYFSLSVYKNY